MHIETQAELLKLSRLLECEESQMAILADQNRDTLRDFRNALSGFFYEQHQESYQRLAGISKLVPAGVSAKLATSVLGSVLAAGIASELPAQRAIKLANKLPNDFLARLCIHLEPGHSRDLLAAMPDDIVANVAKTLLDMEEHITLARFVAVIQPSALEAITAAMDDGQAMVKIALYLEDKSKLNTLLTLLNESQRRETVKAATEQELWPAVLSLNAHLSASLRGNMGDLVAEQGDDVLSHLIQVASEQRLWTDLLQAVNAMSNDHQHQVANLERLREPQIMASLIACVEEENQWDALLPLLPLLDQSHLVPVIDVLTEQRPQSLGKALDNAHDINLLALFGHLSRDQAPRVAKAIQEQAAESWQALVQRNNDAHELSALDALMA